MRHPLPMLALVCAALASSYGAAAATDTSTAIFDPAFRTLKLSNPDHFMAPPVITLGSDERLLLSFDEIGEEWSDLQLRLLHCNSDWQPSALLESEYLDSFNVADIEDYASSQNTFVHFTNYHATVPPEGMEPLVSGNYLVQVFDRDDPDRVILQARFYVAEANVHVSGAASGRTDRGINTEWQQLSMRIDPASTALSNAVADTWLRISMNDQPETERLIPAPDRLDGSALVYEHSPSLVFPAGNEYRRFETVRINYPCLHVDSMRYGGSNYHAYLTPDRMRSTSPYSYDETQRGRFLVHEYNATEPELGADYVTVHFTLQGPEMTGADIYVDGEMTHHRMDGSTRMYYDLEDRAYHLQMPLKQGSYNYRYVAVPRGSDMTSANPAPVEGNFADTTNEFLARFYYRPPGARADRLLSVSTFVTSR